MKNKETKILEVVSILPAGTKLWSPLLGCCTLSSVSGDKFTVEATDGDRYAFLGDGSLWNTPGTECIIFPSKNMHDWSKLLQRGDVLYVGHDRYAVFDHYINEELTLLKARYIYDKRNDKVEHNIDFSTLACERANGTTSALAVASIERHLGGKLNRETLEIVKPERKFRPFCKVLYVDRTGTYRIGVAERQTARNYVYLMNVETPYFFTNVFPYQDGMRYFIGKRRSKDTEREIKKILQI